MVYRKNERHFFSLSFDFVRLFLFSTNLLISIRFKSKSIKIVFSKSRNFRYFESIMVKIVNDHTFIYSIFIIFIDEIFNMIRKIDN